MRTVVLLSGGLDSSTLLYHLLAEGHSCLAFAVDYGQRHSKELDAARAIAEAAGVSLTLAHLPQMRQVFGAGNSQTGPVAVPHGHYADATMRSTVVPNRNMVLLALAGAHAIANGADAVAYAAHAGDHAIYPDCRPAFVMAMASVLAVCHYDPVQLLTPFALWDKAAIVRMGVRYAVPFTLTWSCYEGGERHCGKCGTCVERKLAFQGADIADPTEYAA